MKINKQHETTEVERQSRLSRPDSNYVVRPPVTLPTGGKTDSVKDAVKVSARAAQIGRLTSQANQLPDVRQERVAELRAQVQAGAYQPSAEKIAQAILKDAS